MSDSRVLWRVAPCLLWLTVLSLGAPAAAQERLSGLMSEPIGYTSVADAFDEGDLLDIDVHLTFRRGVTSGPIEREQIDSSSDDGRSGKHFIEVARYEHVVNELQLELDVGLYHDLMLYTRLPIVLGDDRELRPPTGRACAAPTNFDNCEALAEPNSGGMPVFSLAQPLTSKRRSGLPRVDLGVAWGVINQYRQHQLASWVLILEAQIDTGQVLNPCLEGGSCEAGLSTGTARLKLESRWSYRYRYLEPFLGIAHIFQWVTGGEPLYYPAGDLAGAVDPDPPSTSAGVLGVAVIPWEDRARFQRFEIDVSGGAAVISSGRDVSPLFDALGTSENPHLRNLNYDRVGESTRRVAVPFTGITNVEGYADLALDTQIVMQAARYVRFALGVGFSYLTPHLITGAPACNAAVDPGGDESRMGSCLEGILNPDYRPAIDAPGRRFRVDGEVALRLSAAATGQF